MRTSCQRFAPSQPRPNVNSARNYDDTPVYPHEKALFDSELSVTTTFKSND